MKKQQSEAVLNPIVLATPLKEMDGWSDDEHEVYVQKYRTGRLAIFRSSGTGPTGYRVYNDLESLENDFYIKRVIREKNGQIIKVD